jgi:hypothetical protein
MVVERRQAMIKALQEAMKRAEYDGGIVKMSTEVCQLIIWMLEEQAENNTVKDV